MKSDLPTEMPAVDRPAAGGQPSRHAPPRTAQLRVGVLLDGWTERAWVAKVIDDIQQSGIAEVTTVVLNRAPRVSRLRRLRSLLPNLLFALYRRLDRLVFRKLLKIRRDAFQPVDLRPLLSAAQVLEVVPEQKKYTDRFDAATLDWLRGQQLDVVLRFGFRIIRGPILQTARYGVWSFHHGDNREYRGTPPMFWELYEGNPICGVTLQILTDELDGGKAIYRALEKTNQYSLYLNHDRTYWKGAECVLQRLREVHASGESALCELETYGEKATYDKPIYRSPGNLVMLRFLARLATRAIARAVIELTTEEQWSLAWRRRSATAAAVPAAASGPFSMLRPPRGFFFADPMILSRDGRHFVFFEDCEYARKRAVISWIELDAAGRASQPRVALETDCHLSYPFVFEHDNHVYMIPETRERRRIELWRAEQFPEQWTFDRVLIDNISAVDASWLHYQGKYWLFVGASLEKTSGSDALHVFWSDEPFGPWHAHRKNPAVTTVRGARPAGRLFVHEGQLIRPGQDGAKNYGYQINFYHVLTLDDENYRESLVGTLGPEWLSRNLGTHTYNFDDTYEIIDGRVRVLRGLWRRRRPAPQA